MEKIIAVKINTFSAKYCGACCCVCDTRDGVSECLLFKSDDLRFDKKKREYLRCAECLAAEIE
jgi:hypothetical protein